MNKLDKQINILADETISLDSKIILLQKDDKNYLQTELFSSFDTAKNCVNINLNILSLIGFINYKSNRFTEAVDFFENILTIYKTDLSYKVATDILEKLANIYDTQEKYPQSIKVLEKALKLCEQTNNDKDILYFSNSLGSASVKTGNYIYAMENYKKSYDLSIKLGDSKKESICLNNIGNVYFALENIEKALEYFLESLEIRKKLDNKQYLANSLNNIGAIYQQLERFEKAIEFTEKSLELYTEINNEVGISTSLNNLGTAYDRIGEYEKALEFHFKNLPIREKLGNKNRISTTLSNIGNVYKNSQKFDDALKYYQKVIPTYQDFLSDSDTVIIFTNLGSVYLELCDFKKALFYFERGLKISQKIDSKENTKIIYRYLSDYYSAVNNLKKALSYYIKYSEIKDKIYEKNTSKKILELQMNFEIEQQEKEKEIDELKNIGDKYSLITKDLEQRIEKEFIGESKSIKSILKETLNSAKYADTNVIITGESGTGKEIIARIIHHASSRKDYGFYPINCSAIPESLLESEFFGHKKGTFTGAINDKKGLFELAHKGTLFLDEMADMPSALQAKLLRVIEEKKVKKIGNDEEIFVDVRIIAATNKNIDDLIEENTFRLDLYHRINTIMIEIPALRERIEDIEPLFNHFIEQFKKKFNITNLKIKDNLIEVLKSYAFPGNVRELKNLVERALIICENNILDENSFPLIYKKITANNVTNFNISQNENSLIKAALKKTDNNQTKAAKILGISRHTLMRRIAKFNQ